MIPEWVKHVGLPILGVIATVVAVSPQSIRDNILGYFGLILDNWPLVLAAGSPIVSALCAYVIVRRSRPLVQAGSVQSFSSRQERQYQELLAGTLANATRIDAIGISNNRLTSDINIAFYRSLFSRRNGSIRLLFLDPNSDALAEREKLEGRSKGSLKGLVQHNIEDLRRFVKELSLSHEFIEQHFQVRTCSYFAGVNAIIVDKSSIFVHYYGRGTRGFDCPALYFDKTRAAETEFFNLEYDAVWNDSQPVALILRGAEGTK